MPQNSHLYWPTTSVISYTAMSCLFLLKRACLISGKSKRERGIDRQLSCSLTLSNWALQGSPGSKMLGCIPYPRNCNLPFWPFYDYRAGRGQPVASCRVLPVKYGDSFVRVCLQKAEGPHHHAGEFFGLTVRKYGAVCAVSPQG